MTSKDTKKEIKEKIISYSNNNIQEQPKSGKEKYGQYMDYLFL